MGRCEKLLRKARENPGGLSLREALGLAECYGFEHVRTHGSHHLVKRADRRQLLNFQSRGGMTPAYQVRQLLRAIEEDLA